MKSLGDVERCEVWESVYRCTKDGILVKEIMETSELGRRFRYRVVCGDHGLRDYLSPDIQVEVSHELRQTIHDFILIQDVFDT